MKSRLNLFLISCFIVTSAVLLSTLFFLAQMHSEALQLVTSGQEQAIRTFWQLLLAKGDDFRIVDGRMMAGNYVINGNYELPDKIKAIFGGTATIFMDDTRISTNVLKEDGSRAVGTKLSGPAYDAIFKEKRPYRGEAAILGIPYFTAYDPIRDRSGRIIGVMYVGVKQGEFFQSYSRQRYNVIAGATILEILLIAIAWGLLRERVKAEEEVRNMADRIRLITDSVPVSIAYIDTNMRFLFANRRYEELFGVAGEELAGRSAKEVVGDGYFSSREDNIRKVLTGTEIIFTHELLRNDGSSVTLQTAYIPHLAEGKRVVGYFIQHYDITDLTLAQEALRASEEQYRTLFDTTGTAIFVSEDDTTVSLINHEFTKLLGYTREEVEGQLSWTAFVTPESRDQMLAYHRNRRIDPASAPHTYECEMLHRDGSLRNILVHVNLFPGSNRSIISFLDITRHKELDVSLQSQLTFLQTLIDTIPNPIFYKDRGGRYIGCNVAFENYLGRKRGEVVGKTVYDLAPPNLADRYFEMDEALFTGPGVQVYESSVVYADGGRHDVIFNKATFTDTAGEINGLVGVILDITEQKRTEHLMSGEKLVLEMIVREASLSEVLEILCKNVERFSPNALCAVLLLDDDGIHLRHGAAPSLPESYAKAIDGTRIGLNIGACGSAAFTNQLVVTADIATDPHWAKYRKLPLSFGLRACWSMPIRSTNGANMGTFAVYYPESRKPDSAELLLVERAAHLASIAIERKRAVEALREIQLRQQAILDIIPDLIWLKDRDSRFITVNTAYADACNLTPEQLIGKTDRDVWPEDLASKYREDDKSVMVSATQKRMIEQIVDRNGSRRWSETIKMPMFDENGELLGTTGIARDIHDRKCTEDALRESEERFHQLFVQNSDAILLIRMDNFEIIDANPAALELFGYDRAGMLALNPFEMINREDFSDLVDTITLSDLSKVFQLDRAHGIRRNGASITIAIRCKILRLREEYVIHCSIRDITEKVRLEEEVRDTQAKLIHTNKMTSIGMLASSVAHEINNPNNCISINAAMLVDVWQDAEPLLEQIRSEHGDFTLRGIPFSKMRGLAPRLLKGISEGSSRITTIVNNMRDFVREDKSSLQEVIDVNRLIQNAASILWHHIHIYTDIFEMNLQEPLLQARGNSQQIEQVIINLIMNALQSLPDKQAGVHIATADSMEAGTITITVRDEGCGMDQTVMARLREPFFTTKMAEGGTGLGLYISDSIIKEHKGTIRFESSAGCGTTAIVTLLAVNNAT
ncbi:MAG: PAS domain S-box protein [Desulfuromonadales bacterium]|nr:PAS domain S-box protein [Desulfuromonadales bacterium]